jgi:hypothetical protein
MMIIGRHLLKKGHKKTFWLLFIASLALLIGGIVLFI